VTAIGPFFLLVPGVAEPVLTRAFTKLSPDKGGASVARFLEAVRANVGRPLLVTLPLTAVTFGVNYGQGWLIAHAMGLPMSLYDATCLLAIASLLGLLPISVSGVGVREGFFSLAFPMLGFAPALRLGSGLDSRASGQLSEQVIAVLREALSNVGRHAAATRVDVTVDTDDAGVLTVLVRDNGRGITKTSRRSGLANLADRAEQLGGKLRISPADGGGTELEWKVPVPPEVPAGPADDLRAEPQGRYPLR